MSNSTSMITFNDAVANYYKLKHKYDDKYIKEKNKLIKNDVLTRSEKHNRLKQFERKCISCGKSGGTIFKQEKNMLIAYCGHGSNPCKLDIKLQRAIYNNINNQIDSLNHNIILNKIATVKSKYDFLFGYESESFVLDTFNKLKVELIEEVKKYQIVYDQYLNIITKSPPNKQNKQLLILINEFKDLINQFNETDNIDILKEAVYLYNNSINQVTKQIRDVKYSYNGIYHNTKNDEVFLLQEPYTLEQLIVPNPSSENIVISYIV